MDLIVTQAPFRISFAGGGTDLPSFYEKDSGAVVSTTIDKYVYVIINLCRPMLGQGIDDSTRYRIRLSYSSTENVQKVEDLKHPIVREALRLLDVDQALDISTMADVPSGNGLGSSGSFSVAFLHALHLLKGEEPRPEQLAEEAAHIEIDILGRPVGKQDHYAAAFGGLNIIEFQSDNGVKVSPLDSSQVLANQLFPNLLLLHTGVSRDAGTVLFEQKENAQKSSADLLDIRSHAHQLKELLESRYCPKQFGDVLHHTWMSKRTLASGISNAKIDRWYRLAMEAGAMGGKICGAGGGGFLLLVVEPDKRVAVRQALAELTELSVDYDPRGSRVMLPAA